MKTIEDLSFKVNEYEYNEDEGTTWRRMVTKTITLAEVEAIFDGDNSLVSQLCRELRTAYGELNTQARYQSYVKCCAACGESGIQDYDEFKDYINIYKKSKVIK